MHYRYPKEQGQGPAPPIFCTSYIRLVRSQGMTDNNHILRGDRTIEENFYSSTTPPALVRNFVTRDVCSS